MFVLQNVKPNSAIIIPSTFSTNSFNVSLFTKDVKIHIVI